MLDFAHDDRLFPRRAPTKAGRFALTRAGLDLDGGPREAWLTDIKARILAGEYLTDDKLDGALERMLDEAQAC